jgi:hypothetical protein
MTCLAINGQRWIAAAALALSAAVGYDRSLYQVGIIGETLQAESVVLLVRNNNVSDARVFLGDGGSWKYVGPVRGRSTDRFEVWSLAQSGAPLRLLATLNAGRDTVRAGPLTVLSGQSVLLTLEQELSRSGAVVR